MKIGSLVIVRQDIVEYVDVLGKQVGIVLGIDNHTEPQLIEIMWPDGPTETLYSDEVEVLCDV